MIRSILQHEKLSDQLWEELTKLSPGDKFLSIREIMKRYSVSQLTVEKALMRFREDGYLNNQSGKGLFASELLNRFNKLIAPTYLLAVPQWVSVDIDTLEETVKQEKSKYQDKRLLVHKFDISNNVPSQLPLQEENVAGIIVLPTGGELSFKDLQTIKSYSYPTVVLGRHLDNIGVPCVGTDDTFSGSLAANHLIESGHKQVAVLLSEPHNRVIMNRVKAFCDYAQLHEIKVQVIDCEVKSGEYATEKAYRKFSQVLQKDFDFTAVAGISGESMQGAVNACLNNGVNIPEDLSLVAIGAESLAATFYPPVNSVTTNFGQQVSTALEILNAQVSGMETPKQNVFIRPYIIDRGSVVNLNSSIKFEKETV
jgi:DNA-binding LacI/PurR family transcriptional regulator